MECTWKELRSEKEVTTDEALLELKEGSEPCNSHELVIIIIFVVLSLHGNQDIPYDKSHLWFFLFNQN